MRKIAKITYLDHVESKTRPERTKPMRCVIYGEILKETDVYVTVLAYCEKSPRVLDSDDYETENFAMTILKCCILKRENLVAKVKPHN